MFPSPTYPTHNHKKNCAPQSTFFNPRYPLPPNLIPRHRQSPPPPPNLAHPIPLPRLKPSTLGKNCRRRPMNLIPLRARTNIPLRRFPPRVKAGEARRQGGTHPPPFRSPPLVPHPPLSAAHPRPLPPSGPAGLAAWRRVCFRFTSKACLLFRPVCFPPISLIEPLSFSLSPLFSFPPPFARVRVRVRARARVQPHSVESSNRTETRGACQIPRKRARRKSQGYDSREHGPDETLSTKSASPAASPVASLPP